MDSFKKSKYELNDDEQLSKYDISRDALEKANEAMAKISERKNEISTEEARISVGERSAKKLGNARYDKELGAVVRKRTKEDYRILWDYFLEKHEPEFRKKMGYGKNEIERIGYKKFIDAMDWCSPEDTSSWKTDVLHVVPCNACGVRFAIYEQNMALCNECAPMYDIEYMEQLCINMQSINPAYGKSFYARLTAKPNRDKFRILSTEQYFREIGKSKGEAGIGMFGLTCLRRMIGKIKEETVKNNLPESTEPQRFLEYVNKAYSAFKTEKRPNLVEFYDAITDVPDGKRWAEELQEAFIEKIIKKDGAESLGSREDEDDVEK